MLAALGLGAVGFVSGTAALLVAVAVFSVGVVLVRPNEQTVAAGLANPAALGSYFGVASLSLAIGGGAGNYAGGLLYDLGRELGQPVLPWLVFAAVGLVSALGLWLTLDRRPEVGDRAAPTPAAHHLPTDEPASEPTSAEPARR